MHLPLRNVTFWKTCQRHCWALAVEWRTLRHKYDTKAFCVEAREGRAQSLHGLGTNPRLVGEKQIVKSFGAL